MYKCGICWEEFNEEKQVVTHLNSSHHLLAKFMAGCAKANAKLPKINKVILPAGDLQEDFDILET